MWGREKSVLLANVPHFLPPHVAVSTMEDEGKVGEEGEDQRGKMGEKPVQSPLFGLSTEKFADALTSEDAVSGK